MSEAPLPDAQVRTADRVTFPRWQIAVAVLLAAACALGLPPYSGPDEMGHAAYAAALSQGHLPVLPTGEIADLATGTTWQGQHPPLYYLLATPLYLAAGRNAVVGLYLLRLLSIVGLALTVYLIDRVAFALLPRDRAGLATWIVAAHPTVVYVAAMANNEAWAMAFSVACAWAAVNATDTKDDPKRERLWLIAAVAFGGLGLLTKLTAIAGVAAAATIVAQRPERGAGALRGSIVALGAAALWLPWGLLMHRLHGAFVPSPINRPAFIGGPLALTLDPLGAAHLIYFATPEFAIGLLTPYWLVAPFPFTLNPMLAAGWIVTIGVFWCGARQRRFRFAAVGFATLLLIVLGQVFFRDALAVFFLARYSPIATVLVSLLVASVAGGLAKNVRTGGAIALGLISAAGFAYIAYFYTIGPSSASFWGKQPSGGTARPAQGYNGTN